MVTVFYSADVHGYLLSVSLCEALTQSADLSQLKAEEVRVHVVTGEAVCTGATEAPNVTPAHAHGTQG